MRRGAGVVVAGVCLLAGCRSIGLKREVIETTTRSDEQRRETFEATLRVLDEHPEYVDEFFKMARSHPATLDRFISNAAGHLDEKPLAKLTARHLVDNPQGLQEILEQTLDAAKTPQSQAAISRAIGARPKEAARAILTLPDSVQAITEETVLAVRSNPEGRGALLAAMREQAGPLVEILTSDKATLKALAGEVARQLAKKGIGGSGFGRRLLERFQGAGAGAVPSPACPPPVP